MLLKGKETFLDKTFNPSINSSDVAFFGVEFDFTASYASGARFGPRAILESSFQIEFETPFLGIPLDKKIKIHNLGTLSYKKSSKNLMSLSKKMVEEVKSLSLKVLKAKKFLFVLGGDHSVSNGVLKAVSKNFSPKDVCFVNFDAHFDLRNAFEGMPLSHASVSRRINEAGFNQIFIGVRDSVSKEEIEFISRKNLASNIFYSPLLPKAFYLRQKSKKWIKKENLLFGQSSSKKQLKSILSKIKQKFVWFEIDIDVLDSNEFLGTGTPMPSGLTTDALNELLFEIISFAKQKGKKVLGFSLVEVSPLLEKNAKTYLAKKTISTACEMKAALICYNILFYNFLERVPKLWIFIFLSNGIPRNGVSNSI